MKRSDKTVLSAKELAGMMDSVADLIDDAEIKLIISEQMAGDLKEQLMLAHAANLQLRKALTILLAQTSSVKETDEWRYLYEAFDSVKYSALSRLAEVEYVMAGNKLDKREV